MFNLDNRYHVTIFLLISISFIVGIMNLLSSNNLYLLQIWSSVIPAHRNVGSCIISIYQRSMSENIDARVLQFKHRFESEETWYLFLFEFGMLVCFDIFWQGVLRIHKLPVRTSKCPNSRWRDYIFIRPFP